MRSSTLLALLLVPAPALAQTTWYVDASNNPPGSGTANDPYASLQYALTQPTTVDGDTVLVASGTYHELVDFLGKAVHVDGSGSSPVPTIDAGGTGTGVTFRSGEGPSSVLQGVRVQNGAGTSTSIGLAGGAILVDGAAPTLIDVRVRSSFAEVGGGLAALNGASPALDDCHFQGNEAWEGGGLAVDHAHVTLHDGSLVENHALSAIGASFGGGVSVRSGGTLSVTDTRFEHNHALGGGGGGGLAVRSGGLATADGCEFLWNHPGVYQAPGSGGAVHAVGSFLATGCRFEHNGGTDSHSYDAVLEGGAGYQGAYTDCTFANNSAQFGGALTKATASGCTFEVNAGCADGSGFGGAVAFCTVDTSTLAGNWACGDGGGAYSSDLVDCTLISNLAVGTDQLRGNGGGLKGGSALRCTLVGNVAKGAQNAPPATGGGAVNASLERCVLGSNVAEVGGGAHYQFSNAGVRASSFLANKATQGGGGLSVAAAITVRDTALWGNAPDALLDPSNLAAVSYSLVEGGHAGTGNFDADPLWFGPAGSDAHVLAGSPVVDAGDPASPPDADGSRADIGALPYDASWTGGAFPYCEATVWNLACVPLIEGTGTPGMSGPDDFAVTAGGVPPDRPGFLVRGGTSDYFPILGGKLCVGQPLGRFPVKQSSDGDDPCSGTLRQKIKQADFAQLGLAPGDRLYVQFWFRLPQAGQAALSNALEILIQP